MAQENAKSLLLVEDDDEVRETLALILRLEGWAVATAVDGVDALLQLADHLPDIIVTDYMMPRIDGCEMIIRADHDPRICNIPVVVVTAALGVPPALIERSAATIAKPANFASLDALLHEIVD